MFGKRKREGEDNGLHWENMDEIYYLKRILEKQNEILNTLKSVDNNIVKYFGSDCDLKEKELSQKIQRANFNREQFEILKESVAYTKDKYKKRDNTICKITNVPCCYCQPVCDSRKEE